VLGEGGYVVPPPGFLAALRDLCDQHGMLLIADEVQSGFGRTGKWFACEHCDVVPDIMVMAKGIASGMPLAGLASTPEIMSRWIPGSHGGTFGGNPVSCAAAVATIHVLKDEKLVENAARMGEVLLQGLRQLKESHPDIGDVRGKGLMVATEFTNPQGEPWTGRAKAVAKAAFEEGLMLMTCGTYDNVVRWIPPLIVTGDQLEEALEKFRLAMDKVQADA
jgi:4-aminobutyrate aminotransferase